MSIFSYLDPGTGSYIVQIIIGAAVGAGFAVRGRWQQLKATVVNLVSSNKKNTED